MTVSRKAEISPKLTRQSLVVLIQHNLAQFTTSNENGTERTYYVCNAEEILRFLCIGKIMYWAAQEISPEAAAIVKYVAIYGKVKAAELGNVFDPRGTSNNSEDASLAFQSMLVQLVQRKILRISSLHDSKPLDDFKQLIRDEELQAMSALTMPETKKVKEAEERLHRRLTELEDESNRVDSGLKRKAPGQDNGPSSKRVKMTDSRTPSVDPEIVLRINHDKYLVYQRNADLVALCQRRLGPTPAAVYSHILKYLESQVFSCRQDTSSLVFSTLKVSQAIPKEFDLSSVWAEPDSTTSRLNGKSAKVRMKDRLDRMSDSELDSSDEEPQSGRHEADSDDEQFVIEDEKDQDSEDDFDPDVQGQVGHDRINMVNRFLDLFAMDTFQFVRKVGTRAKGEWQIDFKALGNVLKQLEIESVIQQKYGDLAPRLLRIVKDKIKVDEKQLSGIALLKQQDIRHVLTSLLGAGVLDLQEVPKRLDRQPNMTFFLWFHNQQRAISCLSQDLCRSIARVHQRLTYEMRSRQRLLDKSQRTDVRNKEAEYLSRGELQELRKIRNVEEKLLVQSARLSHSYSILADY